MSHAVRLSFALGAWAVSVAGLPAARVWAKGPVVAFDAAQVVSCRDVTSPESLATAPDLRTWEARLEVSSLIREGVEADLTQYFYRFDMLDPAARIEDYEPKTQVASEYAGAIGVEDRDERVRQAGVAVSSVFETIGAATPNVSSSRKKSHSVRYDLLPPKEQVSAAGTLRRERSLFFKLKPSSQTTLEGAKQFAVVFRVPASWRGGLVLLRCDAAGIHRGVWRSLDEPVSAGRSMFLVALHPEGDLEARDAAQQYAEAEAALRRRAAQLQDDLRRQTSAGAFSLKAAFAAPAPMIPERWLEQVLMQPADRPLGAYSRHLPAEVRRQAEAYLLAKQRMVWGGASVDPSSAR